MSDGIIQSQDSRSTGTLFGGTILGGENTIMREIALFIASLAGAAIMTALAVLIRPESPFWKLVLWGGIAIFIACAFVVVIDYFRPGGQIFLLAGIALGTALLIGCGIAFFNQPAVDHQTLQKQEIKAGLEKLFIESDGLWRRLIALPKNISDADYKKLQDDIDNWSRRLEGYVEKELGPLAKARMLEMPPNIQLFGPDPGYPPKISTDRSQTMMALNIQRNKLLQMIDVQSK